ncbi:DEAD/DEAH box helicase family protein [Thiolapillus sp.]|uniref:DEAD/DEAH box helicase family protein n=1 Tax=Thiolapillus sp. TaxID=2017437 RepID=UPI003AF67744
MSRFEDKLILSHWMLAQFGAETLEAMGNTLSADHLIGFDEENSSKFVYELMTWMPEESREVKDDQLRQYDDNIVRHWRRITERRNHSGNTLYPLYFQYLSLLFTEHYLERYFSDRAALCADLNRFRESFNERLPEREHITPFEEGDLNKLAIWIATGGGKTLIMHVNILQFQHYLQKAGRDRDFNRVILLTPNEGLSVQHEQELAESGIEGSLFVKDGGELFTGTGVEIIDIHKLREKSGEKTVAVESFESNNLVLVDEGHRGASGDDWMNKRNQLCENGFSFEYSATFGQAIKAASGSDLAPRGKAKPSAKYRLVQQYAKCILFDYSYKYFHGDGYGKDHYILNLSQAWSEEQIQLYLTGCASWPSTSKNACTETGKRISPSICWPIPYGFLSAEKSRRKAISLRKKPKQQCLTSRLSYIFSPVSSPIVVVNRSLTWSCCSSNRTIFVMRRAGRYSPKPSLICKHNGIPIRHRRCSRMSCTRCFMPTPVATCMWCISKAVAVRSACAWAKTIGLG